RPGRGWIVAPKAGAEVMDRRACRGDLHVHPGVDLRIAVRAVRAQAAVQASSAAAVAGPLVDEQGPATGARGRDVVALGHAIRGRRILPACKYSIGGFLLEPLGEDHCRVGCDPDVFRIPRGDSTIAL